jgi:two-component system, chemotaxis family, CheB/CheR fusion protein
MSGAVSSARAGSAWSSVETVAVKESKPDFCVVGIGASAGSLDALRAFFSRMPARPGFACVVVVHLSPGHESHLVQLLQPYTQMSVRQVTQTVALERDTVYVIPPNANLTSIDTHLRLSELETRRVERAPIDHFLRSLADTHGETAIGVILTGSGSDGALGVRQIRECGGLTIAQDPAEAEYASMPQSAIATGTIDLVLTLRDMAEEIISYCTTQLGVAKDVNARPEGENASALEKILGEVRLRTGHEFATYRTEVVLRSIRRRMRLRHIGSLTAYFEFMVSQIDEARALYNDLLSHVTEFFQDPGSFQIIEGVLKEILARKEGEDGRIRVWSVGCSTGEEAYSVAMLLVEHTTHVTDPPLIQVFASEVSRNSLQLAREGIYPQEIATTVSPERLDRFFIHDNTRFRVRRELRDLVTFASHDIFRDPPYSHLDLIICRALFRDLKPETQRGVLSLFYYALAPHGALLIDDAPADTLGLFIPDSSHARLLRRISGPKRAVPLPPGLKPFARLSGEQGGTPVQTVSLDASTIFRSTIERHAPPGVLVDSSDNVVYFSPTAARYVRIPGGELTRNILALVPAAIGKVLRTGFAAVRSGALAWTSEPFAVAAHGRLRPLVLRIERTEGGQGSDLLLVIFDDTFEPRAPAAEPQTLANVVELQAELDVMHRQLARISTQSRTRGGEDLKSERMRNEELHQVVDQLEIAREELQAVNEELVSLNDENRHRVETLAQLSNDLQHLLESTGLATVIVDRSMKVMRFTPLASQLMRLRDTDVGRPLADLKHQLRYDTFIADVRRVVEDMSEVEKEVESQDGRWFLLRMQPYRSALRGPEGAAVVLLDITARKHAEIALRESDRRKDEFLAVLAHELRNPLAPIGAGIEVLRKAPVDSTLGQQIVVTMARQTKQLVRLVDDLLEVGRITEGKLLLRKQRVDVAEAVRDAVSAVHPLIESMQHTLTLDLPAEPLCVEGDPARLTQVFGNLLHNAARYTPTGGRIKLWARAEGTQAVISIEDNGFGISSQALPNVFEMFYQGAEPRRNSGTGLGIGLTLAKRLIEMHAGSIEAASAGANAGSTFTVNLPIAEPANAEPANAEPANAEPANAEPANAEPANAEPALNGESEQGRVTRRGVLIVDDNMDAAETLRLLMLALGGNNVRTASNGVEALEIGAQLHPEIVLLDLSMPGMDGYELAQHIRAQEWGRRALLVALTGWGQEQHRRRSKEAGFDRHLTKPANAEALRAVLNGN